MQSFVIYFEIYGKKLKTTVLAKSETEAKKKIQEKIIFHKITKEDDALDYLKGIFNMK